MSFNKLFSFLLWESGILQGESGARRKTSNRKSIGEAESESVTKDALMLSLLHSSVFRVRVEKVSLAIHPCCETLGEDFPLHFCWLLRALDRAMAYHVLWKKWRKKASA